MTDLRKAAEMAAYEVPLHELLEGVPEDARLVIDSEDGMSTRFIPVGHLCKRAAEALRQALAQPEKHLKFEGPIHVECQCDKCKAQPEQGSSSPNYPISESSTPFVDAVNMSQERVDETAKGEHEPVWSLEDCIRVIKTLLYIRGIAERGEGRLMRDDETLEQFVLGYVKKLERPEQEPVAWHEPDSFGNVTTYKKWALENGWKPLYTAPPKREWVGLTRQEFEQCVDGLEDLEDCWVAIESKLKEKNG